jgi:hypothetical protein
MQRVTHRFVDLLLTTPVGRRPAGREVVFRGRTRKDTQRAVLRYWLENESRLGMAFGEFRRHCAWTDDDTIVFRREMLS